MTAPDMIDGTFQRYQMALLCRKFLLLRESDDRSAQRFLVTFLQNHVAGPSSAPNRSARVHRDMEEVVGGIPPL